MHDALFPGRQSAGIQLAAALRRFRASKPLILALPRGGVPVAFEIACALQSDLDLLFVRKIGAPGHAELGIGAIVDGAEPQLVLNEEIVRRLAPSPNYIHDQYRKQLAEIERRRRVYLGGRQPIPTRGRTVIVVDDGIATGSTVRAGLRALRKNSPARLVLAVPVAPAEALRELAGECDEIVCLATPEPFYAVGAHYVDFTQTTDEEVVDLLDRAVAFGQRGEAEASSIEPEKAR
jgi:putative phosphoribosyl transferase